LFDDNIVNMHHLSNKKSRIQRDLFY